MGVREIAEQDLAVILEDREFGFGWDINVTDPAGLNDDFVGQSHDIAQSIDMETGQILSGRKAQVTLRISSLAAKGFTLPEGILEKTKKPWIIRFDDINGNPYNFKVKESKPDRTLGVVTCVLANWID